MTVDYREIATANVRSPMGVDREIATANVRSPMGVDRVCCLGSNIGSLGMEVPQ